MADFESWLVAREPALQRLAHLLMVIVQDRTEAILRTTLDGAIERASETAPYSKDEDRRFGLAPSDFP